jgi:hypothetical protein
MDDHEPSSSSLSFTIETFDDPETGQPTEYGRFSRNWQDEEALDVLINKLGASQISNKQALVHIPKGFKGQITWGEVDNRPFLRLAHGTLLGLMRRRDKEKV